jgi:DNA-binding NarL/FixJ family response regulator
MTKVAKPVPVGVLLDPRRPRVDGFEVRKRILGGGTRRLPVVTASSSKDRDLINGYDLRANGYVHKPIRFDELATAIAHLGDYWLLINEPAPPHFQRRWRRLRRAALGSRTTRRLWPTATCRSTDSRSARESKCSDSPSSGDLISSGAASQPPAAVFL